MPGHFLDTSALAKHYHPEPGTAEVDRLWADQGIKLYISRLGAVETVSVFATKVRIGTLPRSDFALLRGRFFGDLKQRRPLIVRVLVKHFQEADRLLQQHSLTHGLYTLDALQLAVALDLHRHGVIDELIASDRILLTVAKLEGLRTRDPEHP